MASGCDALSEEDEGGSNTMTYVFIAAAVALVWFLMRGVTVNPQTKACPRRLKVKQLAAGA